MNFDYSVISSFIALNIGDINTHPTEITTPRNRKPTMIILLLGALFTTGTTGGFTNVRIV